MFGKRYEVFNKGDLSVAEVFRVHLRAIHVDARLLYKHSLQNVGAEKSLTEKLLWGADRKSVGLIQLTGKNIGYINVVRWTSEEQIGYDFEYLVLFGEIPSSLSSKAKLKIKTKSFFSRRVVDIEWRGGTLADTLNGDLILKENLLNEFQLNRPLDIEVVPEPVYQCARIETSRHLPSGSLFDCLDRIAGHIASL